MLEVSGLMRYRLTIHSFKHGLVLVDLGMQGQFAKVSNVSHFLGNFYCKLKGQCPDYAHARALSVFFFKRQ